MSFCVNCGKELKEEEKFCPDCGTENGTEEAKETIITNPAPTYKVAKCFTVFGKIGPILGLISFIIAFIPFVNVLSSSIGPVGIVFCCLGKKDITLIRKCKKGFKFSLWGTILGSVLYFIYIVVLAALGVLD